MPRRFFTSRSFIRRLLLSLFIAMFSPALVRAAGPALAVTTTGERFPATLVRVEADGAVILSGQAEERSFTPRELISWGAPVDSQRGSQIVLADGGLLIADVIGADTEMLEIDSALFGVFELPLAQVAGIVFHPAVDLHERDLLVRSVSDFTGDADHLRLDNGDELSGRLLTLDAGEINVETEVGPARIATSRLAALMFPSAGAAPRADSAPRFLVGLADGGRLHVATLAVDETRLTLTRPDGADWSFAPTRGTALDAVASILSLSAEAVYLSDLPVHSYRHIPFFDLAWPYTLDASVVGGQLRAGGRIYPKGVGMHSASRLTFELDRPFRRFEAELAVDDTAAGAGSVRFRVFADGQERFASAVVRGGDEPTPISVDLRGARRISLIVDFADRGDERDRADWLGARLIP